MGNEKLFNHHRMGLWRMDADEYLTPDLTNEIAIKFAHPG
jgi:hypothetical protein